MRTNNTKRLFWVVVMAGILAALGWWVLAGREPRYAGKPVSYWFREYCRERLNNRSSDVPVEALRKLGTNAVPYLIAQAFVPGDSVGKSNFFLVLNSLPRSWALPQPLFLGSAVRQEQAVWALMDMRPSAHQVLTLLQRHLKSTNKYERYESIFILGTVGEEAEEAVPELEAALRGPDRRGRVLAMQAVEWIGPRAVAATPALMEVLQEPGDSNYLGVNAVNALRGIGGQAAPAIPLVRQVFDRETNWIQKCSVATALLRMDANQPEAMAFLTNGLMTHLPASERWMAARQLGLAGPNAKAAVPALIRAMDGADTSLGFHIPDALNEMGVNPTTYLPELKILLQSSDEVTSAHTAWYIMNTYPADHEAHVALMEIIRRKSFYQRYAIEVLGTAGPAAAEAIPVVREAAQTSQDMGDRQEAREMLKRMEGKN